MQPQQMTIIDTLVREKDGAKLREIFFRSIDSPSLLVSLYDYLRERTQEGGWLDDFLYNPLHGVQNVWFICFKYTRPGELLALFEYDYFAHCAALSHPTKHGEFNSAIDRALCINYSSGDYTSVMWHASAGIFGVKMVRGIAPSVSLTTILYREDDATPSPDTLLNPPLSQPLKWTVFHLMMRRTALLLLSELTHHWETTDMLREASIALDEYALHLRTKMWSDRAGNLITFTEMSAHLSSSDLLVEQIYEFFTPTQSILDRLPLDGEVWQRLIFSAVEMTRNCEGLPMSAYFIPARFHQPSLDAELTIPSEDDRYAFCYADTPEMRRVYHNRIVALTTKEK
jgi:hypothetical protein